MNLEYTESVHPHTEIMYHTPIISHKFRTFHSLLRTLTITQYTKQPINSVYSRPKSHE